jgi:uncharacterized repeat protein (TIGR02543 family)
MKNTFLNQTNAWLCLLGVFFTQVASAQTTYTFANTNVTSTMITTNLYWLTTPTVAGWSPGTPVSGNANTIQFFQDTTTPLVNIYSTNTESAILDNGGAAFQLGTLSLEGLASATASAQLTMTLSGQTTGDALNFSAATGTINLDSLNNGSNGKNVWNVNNPIQLGTVGSAGALTIQGNGTATFNINGAISELQTGGGSVVKTGASTVWLDASNSFTGGLFIKKGTLATATNPGKTAVLGGNGTGQVTLGDAAGGPAALLLGWQSYINPITLGTGAVCPLTIGDALDNGGNNNPNVNGGINLNGNNLNIIKTVGTRNLGIGGTAGITGAGSLIFSNLNNTAAGTISVSAPLFFTGSITNIGIGTNATVISSKIGSGVMSIVESSATSGLTLSGMLTNSANGTTLINAGGGLLKVTGGTTGTGNLVLNNNSLTNDAITLSTTTVNHAGSITNSGTGSGETLISAAIGANVTAVVQNSAISALNLSGVNTYSGDTTISAGTLVLSGAGSMANTPNIWVASGAAFDVSTPTTAYTLGSSQTLKATATGANATSTIKVASGKNLTLGGTTAGVEFTAYGGGATAPLTLAGTGGNLALNSKPIKVDTTSVLSQGPYTLIAHGGSATVNGVIGGLDTTTGSGINANATGVLSVNGSGDLILTLTYPVTFISNGGSSVATQNVNYNGTATQPSPNPTQTGYAFAGWYSNPGLTTLYNFSTPVTGPVTLYAKWNAAVITPTKLLVTTVPTGTTPAGSTFSVTVAAVDANGNAGAVTSDTGISLTASGSGTLGGNTATIPNGQSSATLTGVTYTKAQTITLTSSRTSGMSLATSVASSAFTIIPDVTTATANSTVVANPASLAANNSTLSTVTATLMDAYGNLFTNASVSWSVTGSGNTVNPSLLGTANGSGVATFTVKSTKAETKTLTFNLGATVITSSLTIDFTNSASGIVFTWDPSLNTIGSDGVGTWDTSTASWANSSADFAWPNNGNDTAVFGTNGALAGNNVITLGGPLNVGNLTFNTTGANKYSLGSGNTITLGGLSPTISVAGTAQIDSVLDGANGLTKTGNGLLTLSAANTFTGGLVIKNGTVKALTNPGTTRTLGGSGTGSVTLGDAAGGPITLLLGWQTYNNPITLVTNAVGPIIISDSFEFNADDNNVNGGITLNGNNLNLVQTNGTGVLSIGGVGITGIGSITISNMNNKAANANGSIRLVGPVNITGSITNIGIGTNTTVISGAFGSNVTYVVQNSVTAPLIFHGYNNFDGHAVVNAGTLILNTNTLNNKATVTVASGATVNLNFDTTLTNTVAGLVLNGSAAAAGVHNATTDPTYLTGTGNLLVANSVATYSTNITFSVSGSTMTLIWPVTHLGWYAQSNSVDLTVAADWHDILGSQLQTSVTNTINPALTNLFYRLSNTSQP